MPHRRPRRRPPFPALATALLALCVCCFAVVAQPTTAPAEPPELFAHASADRLWYALVTPATIGGPDRHTFIRTRQAQGKWEALVDFPTPLTSMSDADGRLIVSLADGEWKRITPDQFLGGPPLPDDGEILALSSGAEGDVWCVGFGTTPAKTVTRPVTTQLSITTRPAAAVMPALFHLEAGGWRQVALLPTNSLDRSSGQISLAFIDRAPTFAYVAKPGTIAVHQWRQRWESAGQITTGFAIRKLSLLGIEGKLALWAVGEQGPGTLFLRDSATGAWNAKPLKVGPDVAPVDVALAAFHGELRLLAVTADQRFFDQRFDFKGNPAGPWRQLDQPAQAEGPTLGDLLSWAGLAILMVITLATANQGGVVQVAVVNKVRLPLAPLALRLAAGLIDLWPCYIGLYIVSSRLHDGAGLTQLPDDAFVYWVLGAALLVYFLHTAIAELIWGRSFGKMFVGLRVLSLAGEKPSVGSTLLRNLIRVIEVPIVVPLLMIFLNPLRQRFGDFFASTVVTRKLPRELQEKLD